MRRLLLWTAIGIGSMALALAGVRVVGALTRTGAAAMLDAGPCAQPCWHGIQPGQTTFEDAQTLLRGRTDVLDVAYSTVDSHLHWITATEPPWRGRGFRWSAAGGGAVDFILMEPPPDVMRLGDAVAIFGAPVVSTLCWRFDNNQPNLAGKLPRPFLGAHVYFNGDVEVLAYNPTRPTERRFDPDMVVWSVTYNYPDQEPPYRFDAPIWRGFTVADDSPVC